MIMCTLPFLRKDGSDAEKKEMKKVMAQQLPIMAAHSGNRTNRSLTYPS